MLKQGIRPLEIFKHFNVKIIRNFDNSHNTSFLSSKFCRDVGSSFSRSKQSDVTVE